MTYFEPGFRPRRCFSNMHLRSTIRLVTTLWRTEDHPLNVGTLAPLARLGAVFGANTLHLGGRQIRSLFLRVRRIDLGRATDGACSSTPDNWRLPMGTPVGHKNDRAKVGCHTLRGSLGLSVGTGTSPCWDDSRWTGDGTGRDGRGVVRGRGGGRRKERGGER